MTSEVQQKTYVLWQDYKVDCGLLAAKVCNFSMINRVPFYTVIALPRGGMFPGQLVGYALEHKGLEPEGPYPFIISTTSLQSMMLAIKANVPRGKPAVLVDDIWDSGETMKSVIDVLKEYCGFVLTATVYWKSHKPKHWKNPDVASPDLWVQEQKPGNWLVLPFDKDD